MKKILIFTVILLLPACIYSQSFVEPVEDVSSLWTYSRNCIITTTEGEELQGKLFSGYITGGGIKSVTIKDENGEKTKMNAALISSMKVKASDMIKFWMVVENTGSIKEITNMDFNEVMNKEYLIFEQALMPKKKDKSGLLQLLNPGFDSKIKVYVDPKAKETKGVPKWMTAGVQVGGGEDKSYLFVKNQEKSIKVKKGNYKKEFSELYDNCQIMMEMYEGKKIKFKDLAGHVFIYDQVCN